MTLNEYHPAQGFQNCNDERKSDFSNFPKNFDKSTSHDFLHWGGENGSLGSSQSMNSHAGHGLMTNHYSHNVQTRTKMNDVGGSFQNQQNQNLYSVVSRSNSASTDTEDEVPSNNYASMRRHSMPSWNLGLGNVVGAGPSSKQGDGLDNLNFGNLHVSSSLGSGDINPPLFTYNSSNGSYESSNSIQSSSFHSSSYGPSSFVTETNAASRRMSFSNTHDEQPLQANDTSSRRSSITSIASTSSNVSSQFVFDQSNQNQMMSQQQRQYTSSKRANKWKKNKKKYEEQLQNQHKQLTHGTKNHKNEAPNESAAALASSWTQQHQSNQAQQWSVHDGKTAENGNTAPPLLSRTVSNSSKSTISSHFEDSLNGLSLSMSQSISSTNSSPQSHYSISDSRSSMSTTNQNYGKSDLSSSAASFRPTTRSVAAAVAAVPFSNVSAPSEIPKNFVKAAPNGSSSSFTTNVLAAANAVASSSSSKTQSIAATHTARADGELSTLRRQVERKQKSQMMLANEQQQGQWSLSSSNGTFSYDEISGQSSTTASTMGNSTHGSNMPSIMPSSYDMNSIGEESEYTTNTASIDYSSNQGSGGSISHQNPKMKKREWLIRMNRRLSETPVGKINPDTLPITAIMNAWAKTKSAEGADMVEMWLKRVKEDKEAGNDNVEITTKMYTMAVDAWAKSGEKGAAKRAESILHDLNQSYQESNHDESLRPTTGIFNAVINAWARSGEKIAPQRAEQIFEWMEKLCARGNYSIKPDKYTFNTVIHAYAKFGGKEAAIKAQQLLKHMHRMHMEGNATAKPDTITYNVVINCLAKSGGKGAALEAEKLLSKMHMLHDGGDSDVKPNVVTYGAVIDAWAKSGETGAAGRADNILANMIKLHQSDPVRNADLRPNTYTFNTVINAWAKSKEQDAASKAEEMLVAMGRLHACGIPGLKPDAFTYTAVIDAWAKSGYRGAAARADQLLDKMEAQFQAGDFDLKPNTFTYNAVINALAKSGEAGAAARAERVLHNMVKRHKQGGMNDDVKPTTINFNTVLDAWAKSGGKGAAQRAEEILEWMDHLNKSGNADVKPDTITFNAVIDAWARSGDKRAPIRAEQILDHMDDLYQVGNKDVKPDTYTYNTVINAWAKSGERGSAARAEQILAVMERRYRDGDKNFKPNTRTHTSVIDAWAKSGERGAASRAEHILNTMQTLYESKKDPDIKPNAHTCNAVMNACAFTKTEEDRGEALEIAFRVFDWLSSRPDMHPDAYTFTILLSVCSNLLPKEDEESRFTYAQTLFNKCCAAGHVNHFVLRKLKQTVTEDEYIHLVGDGGNRDAYSENLPAEWTRNAKMGSRNRRGSQWKPKGASRRHSSYH